ncbi:MAG TPA: L-rhamnose mutarotase [Puia sp.]
MKRYCLALDLREDEGAISAYDDYHTKVWPEVKDSLKEAGILDMEIFRTHNRLFMILKVVPDFSFEKKKALDEANSKVQEWETLMSQFQLALPWSKTGEKWLLMERVFKLEPGE